MAWGLSLEEDAKKIADTISNSAVAGASVPAFGVVGAANYLSGDRLKGAVDVQGDLLKKSWGMKDTPSSPVSVINPVKPVQGEVAKPNPNGIVPDKSWADVVAAANVKQSEPPEAAKGIGQDPEITKAIQEIKANKGNYDRQGNMYSEAEKRIGDLVGHGVTASTSEKTAQLTKGQHTQYEMARLEETKRMNDIHAQDFQLRLAQQKDTATANRTAKLVEDFSFNEQSPSGEKIKNMPLTYYNIGLGGDVPEAIKKPVQDVMNEAEEYVAKRTPPGKKLTPALRQAAIKDWIKAKRIHPEI